MCGHSVDMLKTLERVSAFVTRAAVGEVRKRPPPPPSVSPLQSPRPRGWTRASAVTLEGEAHGVALWHALRCCPRHHVPPCAVSTSQVTANESCVNRGGGGGGTPVADAVARLLGWTAKRADVRDDEADTELTAALTGTLRWKRRSSTDWPMSSSISWHFLSKRARADVPTQLARRRQAGGVGGVSSTSVTSTLFYLWLRARMNAPRHPPCNG